MMKTWCSAVDDESVEVELATGEVRRSELHEGFRAKSSRALDLRRAYRQVPICPSMQCLCVVGLWHPKYKRLKYYVLRVLPFGARNSVYTFGTIAFALSCVLVSLFKLSLTQCVDDFPQVEPRASAESALVCEAVLALLGWEVKQVDGKVPAFDQSFVALGVEYDMHAADRDLLVIRDKPGRHEKVEELVSKIVGGGQGRFESMTADLP